MQYALKVSLINEDGDEEKFEIVPTVSYEQGAEAVLRMTRYYENQLSKVEDQLQDEEK